MKTKCVEFSKMQTSFINVFVLLSHFCTTFLLSSFWLFISGVNYSVSTLSRVSLLK